ERCVRLQIFSWWRSRDRVRLKRGFYFLLVHPPPRSLPPGDIVEGEPCGWQHRRRYHGKRHRNSHCGPPHLYFVRITRSRSVGGASSASPDPLERVVGRFTKRIVPCSQSSTATVPIVLV